MSKMKFMNIVIDNITTSEAIGKVTKLIIDKKKSYIVTPNVDHIVQLEKDSEFRKAYQGAELVLVDGKPLIWISKLYGTPIKEKISGSDLFPLLCELAAKKGFSMFFLGAKEGVAEIAANNLRLKYKGLNIVGTYSPPMGFEKSANEIEKAISIVNNCNPDILIIALGAPKQEKFIMHYKDRLNATVSLGLGASLDFEAKTVKRAPKWMSDHGLEWFYRFLQEPGRLFKRYFVDDIQIIKLIIKYR